MVLVSGKTTFVVCYDCQKNELSGEITDPEMKKLFDIPEELYKKSSFLRSIKSNYLKFGKLTDKQKEAFVKVAKELQKPTT